MYSISMKENIYKKVEGHMNESLFGKGGFV